MDYCSKKYLIALFYLSQPHVGQVPKSVQVDLENRKGKLLQVPHEYDGSPQLTRGQCQTKVGHLFVPAMINIM